MCWPHSRRFLDKGEKEGDLLCYGSDSPKLQPLGHTNSQPRTRQSGSRAPAICSFPLCSLCAALAWGRSSASDQCWLLAPVFDASHLPKYPRHGVTWREKYRTWRQMLGGAGTGNSFSLDSLTLQLMHGLTDCTTTASCLLKLLPIMANV